MSKGKVAIEVTTWSWTCGDGCCTDWGVDVVVSLDDKVIMRDAFEDFGVDDVSRVLKALGYEVLIEEGEHESRGGMIEWDYDDWEDEKDAE